MYEQGNQASQAYQMNDPHNPADSTYATVDETNQQGASGYMDVNSNGSSGGASSGYMDVADTPQNAQGSSGYMDVG